MMTQKEIHELLQLFVGNDPYRPKFKQPWRDSDNVFATDNCIMMRVRGSLTDHDYPIDSHRLSIQFPWGNMADGFIPAQTLDMALANAPLVDELVSRDSDKECPECHGEGTVEWGYSIWTKEFDCPVCDGEGYIEKEQWVPSGRKIISDQSFIRIENKLFRSYHIDLIRRAMTIIGINRVDVGVTDYNSPNLFRLTPDIELILMPCSTYLNSDSIHAEIQLKKL